MRESGKRLRDKAHILSVLELKINKDMENYRFTTHIFSYLPSRFEATIEQKRTRRLIWNFKNGCHNFTTLAAERVADALYNTLCSRDVIFCCIPASSEAKNTRRYERFSTLVSQKIGITNGFSHIKIQGNRLAIHESRHNKTLESVQVIDFDADFFAGRDVVIFDDIITTGSSFKQFTKSLESLGARVIGGVFLAKTICHEN